LTSPPSLTFEVTVNQSAVTRKLAAILVADVVGFSRHMERDDAGSL
jgi:class 3 adenylate cyclase